MGYPSKDRECAHVFREIELKDVNREVVWNCAPIVDNSRLKCIAIKEKAKQSYIDEWDNVIDRGSYVVQGLYN